MFTINGTYNAAVVYTDNCDSTTVEQITNVLNQPFMADSKMAIMPDCHAGKGAVIGTTMTITDKIVPNLVGVDIGCGMTVIELGKVDIDLSKLDAVIHDSIPAGFNIRETPHHAAENINIESLRCRDSVEIERAKRSIGTLGGGNHFIELGMDDEGNKYLIIHTGSRHLGIEVAKHYQKRAYDALSDNFKSSLNELISAKVAELKAAGRAAEINAAVTAIRETPNNINEDLAYCEGELFKAYIHDMGIMNNYAAINRAAIAEEIISLMGFKPINEFETIHNYVDTEAMILRKGAVRALAGERLIIPMNMRDGSLICVGKGNADWNCSAPHGAGRIMSRGEARHNLSMDAFRASMNGIYSSTVSESTIDESPMVYKPMDEIINNIGDTVAIERVIKPVYNFKASGE